MSPLRTFALCAVAGAAILCGSALRADDKPETKPASGGVTIPFHGNKECPLMGEPAKEKFFVEKDGQRIYFCCAKCKGKANADFEKTLAKAYPADKVVDAKNASCPVCAKPCKAEDAVLVIQGNKIHLCSKACETKAKASMQRCLALALDPTLIPLDNMKCPVSGKEASGGEFFVYDGVLINGCCDKCPAEFGKDPAKALKNAGIDLDKVKAEHAKKMEKDAGKDPKEPKKGS